MVSHNFTKAWNKLVNSNYPGINTTTIWCRTSTNLITIQLY